MPEKNYMYMYIFLKGNLMHIIIKLICFPQDIWL